MPDVIALGELLIDFVSTVSGVTLAEAPSFQKAAGGAPANVAVGLARLNVSSGFMGKVGDDPFGHFLADTLATNGVSIQGVRYDRKARTGLAFVSIARDGERDFVFYRHPSADMLYRPDEVDASLVEEAKIFHFGSISLSAEPSRSATLRAVDLAHEAQALISYDPNLRLALWPDEDSAREGILLGWARAHVIKVSDAELHFLTGLVDPREGARRLWHEHLHLLAVTHGAGGCTCITPRGALHVPGYEVQAVDTTGAGDGFVAGLLKGLLAEPQGWEDDGAILRICRYANAVGAITTTRRGAIPALPTEQAIDEFLRDQGA